MPTQVLSGQAAVSQDGTGTVTFSLMQITNVNQDVTANDFDVIVQYSEGQLAVTYTYKKRTSISSDSPTKTLSLKPPPNYIPEAEHEVLSTVYSVQNLDKITLLSGTLDLVCDLNLGLAIYQSASTSQSFYCVLIDLPSDTSIYPNPSATTAVYDSTTETINYTLGYDLPPINTAGSTITYMLTPFSTTADPGSIKTVAIYGKSGSTPVKGSATGIRLKSLPVISHGKSQTDEIKTYQCRTFVIQSATNTSTYFVGALVDFPATKQPTALETINTNELDADIIDGASTTTTTTYLVGPKQSAYDGTSDPPTATYIAIFIKGYNATGYKGDMLFPSQGINQYDSADQIDWRINLV